METNNNIESATFHNYWSFDRKTLLHVKANAQKMISVILGEMHAFQLEIWNAQNSWFPLKSVSILGIGDWRLSRNTYEMCASQADRKTRYGNSVVLINIELRQNWGISVMYWNFFQATGSRQKDNPSDWRIGDASGAETQTIKHCAHTQQSYGQGKQRRE